MKNFIFIVFLFAISAHRTVGQTQENNKKNTIKGKILEKEDKTPLEYANVLIYTYKDSTIISGASSNKKGKFEIKDIPDGHYYLLAKYLGYKDQTIPEIFLDKNTNEYYLGPIILEPSSENLDEIDVRGKAPIVEYELDKKVIPITTELSDQYSSVAELMENLPSITTNQQGEVEIKGETRFMVLIDGKPSIIDNQSILQQIPAGHVQKIELITNPSAKYNPDGGIAGIVNIITKKDRNSLISGKISLKGESGERYNGNAVVNVNGKKTSFFAIYDKADGIQRSDYIAEKYEPETINDIINRVDANQRFHKNTTSFFIGIEQQLSQSTTINLSGNAGRKINDILLRTQNSSEGENTSEKAEKYTLIDYYTAIIDFQHRFNDQGHKLSGFVNFGHLDGEKTNDLSLRNINENLPDSFIYATEDGYHNTTWVQADYVLPLKNGIKLEGGIQLNLINKHKQYTSDLNPFIENACFTHDIYAAYLSLSGNIAKLSYQLAVRTEYADRRLSYSGRYNASYNLEKTRLFPSVHLNYQFSEKLKLQASYSKRLNRPESYYLEPFFIYDGFYRLHQGNPDLKPEILHQIELSLIKRIDAGQWTFGAFFYDLKDDFFKKLDFDDLGFKDEVFFTKYENISSGKLLGVEAEYQKRLCKWFHLEAYVNFYYKSNNPENLSIKARSSNVYRIDFNSTFIISPQSRFSLKSYFSSPTVTPQGEREAYGWLNLSYRRYLIPQKLAATLEISDIFNSSNDRYVYKETDKILHTEKRIEPRVVKLTLNYRFNKFKSKSRKIQDKSIRVDSEY